MSSLRQRTRTPRKCGIKKNPILKFHGHEITISQEEPKNLSILIHFLSVPGIFHLIQANKQLPLQQGCAGKKGRKKELPLYRTNYSPEALMGLAGRI